MSDAPLMLGVSGLRGIVGESLTPEVAVRYAGAFGTWLRDQVGIPVRVGLSADGRAGWQSLAASVRAGLLSSGCDVVDLGVLTTPTVGHAVDDLELQAGVIITASHNPQEWNGIKLLISDADSEDEGASEWIGAAAPDASRANRIIDLYQKGEIEWVQPGSAGESLSASKDAVREHAFSVIAELGLACGDIDSGEHRLCVVVDSVNCSGVRAVQYLLDLHRIQCVQLHGSSSGIFPHTPEPTAENLSGEGGLCDAVPGLNADVGFAQDPDADRLAIIDENGRYIGEEYTLALCALSLLSAEQRESSGEKVLCANLSTSRMVDDIAAAHGARVVRTAVGEANVVEAMKRLKAEGCDVVLGGEGNGGVIWPDVVYVRDSLGSMALVLSLMARTGKSVSELVASIDAYTGGAPYAILKSKQPLASKADAVPAIERIASHYRGQAGVEVDTQDGVRVDWPAQKAWVHVRASNTEPILRVISEAPGAESAKQIADEVGAMI